ncbi:MAG: hypothetical protein J6X60_10410 [Ruminiclostridium sp.]|nr:hypothetical protein [Ruminiclostridium sp.]
MFLLSLLGLGAICAAEKIYDTHNCSTYKYKDDYKGWARDVHKRQIEWIREREGEEGVRSFLKRNNLL